jgi:quercetin dioxygenase-like cupin family protein
MAKILKEEDIQFEKVAWGLTKELVNPQTVGAKKVKVKITEWLPGHVHKKHIHPDQEEVIFVLSGKAESLRAIVIKAPPEDEEVQL